MILRGEGLHIRCVQNTRRPTAVQVTQYTYLHTDGRVHLASYVIHDKGEGNRRVLPAPGKVRADQETARATGMISTRKPQLRDLQPLVTGQRVTAPKRMRKILGKPHRWVLSARGTFDLTDFPSIRVTASG